ncbi:MAG: DUF3467 domain-containing protein [Paludibacteraceae bacterium]|nr:DUF3467 domain-containing protein [Paludibacteraceae bacterium]
MEDQNEKKPLSIEISEEVAEGIYSNMAIISHSSSEFVIDFLRILPNAPKARVKTRIVLTPEHAKRLMIALQSNLKKYEEMFGPISGDGDFHGVSPLNFNTFSGGGEA